jgi:hypothetical protein
MHHHRSHENCKWKEEQKSIWHRHGSYDFDCPLDTGYGAIIICLAIIPWRRLPAAGCCIACAGFGFGSTEGEKERSFVKYLCSPQDESLSIFETIA